MLIRDILEIKGTCSGAPRLYSVAPDSSMRDAIRTMRAHGIGSVVIRRDERLLGLITLREILAALDLCGGEALDMAVGDVMNPLPITGFLDESIDHVRQIMTEHHVSHLPIMDGERLVDIISLQDVAKAAYNECRFENQLLKHYINYWPEEEAMGA